MTTQTLYGERLYDRYIKHPAYSSTNPLSDGWAVDAGTAMLVQSNHHHLASQSHRQLVTTTGTTAVYSWKDLAGLWDGFTDVEPSIEGAPFTAVRSIPWSTDSTGHAMKFGPFQLIFDRLSGGVALARKIRMRVLASMTSLPAGDHQLYYALSPIWTTPRGECWAFAEDTFDSGAAYYTADLTPDSPAIRGRSTMFPSRGQATAGPGSAYSSDVWAYLWIGWRMINGTTNPVAAGCIDAISAWEIP